MRSLIEIHVCYHVINTIELVQKRFESRDGETKKSPASSAWNRTSSV